MRGQTILLSIASACFCLLFTSCDRNSNRLDGHWKLIPEKSGTIDPWSDLVLDIHKDGNHVTIVKHYLGGNPHDRRVDSMTVNTQGNEEIASVAPGRWLGEVSMGIYYGPDAKRHVVARLSESHNEFSIDMRETLETAQGEIDVDVKTTYGLSSDGSMLSLIEHRSTRKSGPPMNYTFARATP